MEPAPDSKQNTRTWARSHDELVTLFVRLPLEPQRLAIPELNYLASKSRSSSKLAEFRGNQVLYLVRAFSVCSGLERHGLKLSDLLNVEHMGVSRNRGP